MPHPDIYWCHTYPGYCCNSIDHKISKSLDSDYSLFLQKPDLRNGIEHFCDELPFSGQLLLIKCNRVGHNTGSCVLSFATVTPFMNNMTVNGDDLTVNHGKALNIMVRLELLTRTQSHTQSDGSDLPLDDVDVTRIQEEDKSEERRSHWASVDIISKYMAMTSIWETEWKWWSVCLYIHCLPYCLAIILSEQFWVERFTCCFYYKIYAVG